MGGVQLINDSVCYMAVKFSAFGSTVLRVPKLWDNLGTTTNLNPMATDLQYPYANQSLLFARHHAKLIA